VAKMSLKLLLLFVEYTEFNSLLLLQAVSHVDTQNGEHGFCFSFAVTIVDSGVALGLQSRCSLSTRDTDM